MSASSSLFCQNQFAVTGATQTVFRTLMLDKYFVSLREQGIAVDGPIPILHAKLALVDGGFRNCAGLVQD
jgi:hypothetical protein